MLFAICCAGIAGIILVQLFWIGNYNELNKERFLKEANIAFEDAVKTEFSIRTDTLEELLFRYLNDTSKIKITSHWHETSKMFAYMLSDALDTLDYFSFKGFTFPLTSQTDTNRSKVARQVAKNFRKEDLDRHIIFYKTQALGRFLNKEAEKNAFDTSRLRPIFEKYLKEREIKEEFYFFMQDEVKAANDTMPFRITGDAQIVTKAFPTYRNIPDQNFVRAVFISRAGYLLAKSLQLLMASAALLLIVGFCFFYLLKVIKREKQHSAIKNDFIHHITHEFKTPIATVFSAVEALDDFNVIEDRQKTKRYLQLSKVELRRLSDLVTKVLNISLYENSTSEHARDEVKISDILNDLTNSYGASSERKVGIHLQNFCLNPTVRGDKVHLYSALANIVDNAIKYSERDPEIYLSVSDRGPDIRIEIRDNGIGISNEQIHMIFEKFYRTPMATAQTKGHGLGLSYTKKVIERHQGRVDVKSRVGEGSTFIITLPKLK